MKIGPQFLPQAIQDGIKSATVMDVIIYAIAAYNAGGAESDEIIAINLLVDIVAALTCHQANKP